MVPCLIILKAGSEEVIVRLSRCLVMVLSLSADYVAGATVTRSRVLESLLEIMKEVVGKIVRFFR